MANVGRCVLALAALVVQPAMAHAQDEARSFASPQLRLPQAGAPPPVAPAMAGKANATDPYAATAQPPVTVTVPTPPPNAAGRHAKPTAQDLANSRAPATAQAAAANGWPASEILIAKARCTSLLKSVDAVYVPVEAMREGDCGAAAPVQLMAIGKSPQVVISPPAIVTCDLVVALAEWLDKDLQPSARKLLGSPIVKLENMSSYSCRNAYGRARTRMSEHGRANAVDIRGFLTASGHGTDLLADWGPTMRDIRAAEIEIARAAAAKAAAMAAAQAEAERKQARAPAPAPVPVETGIDSGGIGTLIEGVPRLRVLTPNSPEQPTAPAFAPHSRLGGPKPPVHGSATPESGPKVVSPPGTVGGTDRKQRFLRDAHAAACRTFKTVLGPEANNAHRNHFHLDMAERSSGTFCE